MVGREIHPADEAVYLAPTPIQVGFRACCPRCGEGRLYDGLLKPGRFCTNCDLNYEFIDAGDGPAVFVILIIGFIATGLAMALQLSMQPPIWLQMVIWAPVVTVLSIWGLRFSKGIMIALQFQTSAKQGELGDDS